MTEPHDCDHCEKFCYGSDRHTGYDLSDCPEWDRMTDEETELSNQGKCPYWVKIEDNGEGYDPEELV